MTLKDKRIGFAMTGSFCTFETALACLDEMVSRGAEVTPVLSYNADTLDTRFNTAAGLKETLARRTNRPVIRTLQDAEPIGPKRLFDVLVVLPATGNTLAKLACGITDTPVAMAVKSHLRNGGPVVLGVSTNDGLSNSAKNIGTLLNTRNIYFIPFRQDDPMQKPRSLVFVRECVIASVERALDGEQLQPLLM